MIDFDVYVILKDSDWPIVRDNLTYIKKNIAAQNCCIISSSKIHDEATSLGYAFLDENAVYPGLTFQTVESFLQANNLDTNNTGWYLQQFIKYAIAYSCEKEYYLVWDADTIPLSPIDFFDENGTPFFNLKREYFKVYFDFIERTFGIKKTTPESFISEHMMFNKTILLELLSKITESRTDDNIFWHIILLNGKTLKNIDHKDQRFFSEFETYGTYIDHYHPNLYKKRKLKTLRSGADFLGYTPSSEVLDWASTSFDTISLEKWAHVLEFSVQRVCDTKYRASTCFAEHVKNCRNQIRKTYYKAFFSKDKETVTNLAPIIGSWKFDFFFGKSLPYHEQNILLIRLLRRGYLIIKYLLFGE